jgi:5'-nucleotidase
MALVGRSTLQEHGRGEVLPDGVELNVNYPLVAGGGAPRGVALTETGVGFLDVGYNGPVLPAVGQSASYPIAIDIAVPETVPNADSTALANDEVAITPIEANYDLARADARFLRRVVRSLD